MPRSTATFFLLCAAAALLAAQSVVLANNGRHHRSKKGNYAVTVAGTVNGAGAATITTSISMSVLVHLPNGASGALVIENLPLDPNGYFVGAGTLLGVPMRVSGRVDIPAGNDDETTPKQANTARLTAVLRSIDGNVARLVGIQSNNANDHGG